MALLILLGLLASEVPLSRPYDTGLVKTSELYHKHGPRRVYRR